jgi:hypothetical protein
MPMTLRGYVIERYKKFSISVQIKNVKLLEGNGHHEIENDKLK